MIEKSELMKLNNTDETGISVNDDMQKRLSLLEKRLVVKI